MLKSATWFVFNWIQFLTCLLWTTVWITLAMVVLVLTWRPRIPLNMARTIWAPGILWMAGGMAHTETFDPKKYTAFEPGLRSDAVLSTFKEIDTAVDDIKISEGLENVASVMDRATLMRTYQAGDLGFILHSRHQYQWHTGYAPPLTVAAPHIGAVIACTLGPLNPDVPAFIELYRQGRLPVDRLKSGTLTLEQINEGFDRLADVAAVRQIVTFG